MLAIFVATISISFASYARTVLLDATIEGARYAALADQDLEAGIRRTKQLVARSLGGAFGFEVLGHSAAVGSLRSIRLVSSAYFSFSPASKLLTVSSVATSEIEY
jgi:hypothetical protein